MTDSHTHTEEVDEPRQKRPLGCLIPLAVFVALVVLAIVRNIGVGEPEDGPNIPSANAPAATSQDNATPGATTATQPTGPLASYVSLDGSQLDGDISLIGLFEDELRVSGNANNRFISLLGLPDQLDLGGEGRAAHWTLPGSATVQIVEGESITVFCGDNIITAHVGDGVVLCRSTLEEANLQASDGIGVYTFGPNAAGDAPGDWVACGSSVIAENARLEFRVNATSADGPGSSAAEASPSDVINLLRLSRCE